MKAADKRNGGYASHRSPGQRVWAQSCGWGASSKGTLVQNSGAFQKGANLNVNVIRHIQMVTLREGDTGLSKQTSGTQQK